MSVCALGLLLYRRSFVIMLRVGKVAWILELLVEMNWMLSVGAAGRAKGTTISFYITSKLRNG